MVATETWDTTTVTAADPVTPSTTASIVVAPAATAVTWPAAETRAMAGFRLVHVTGRPVTVAPAASKAAADADTESPWFSVARRAAVTRVTGPGPGARTLRV